VNSSAESTAASTSGGAAAPCTPGRSAMPPFKRGARRRARALARRPALGEPFLAPYGISGQTKRTPVSLNEVACATTSSALVRFDHHPDRLGPNEVGDPSTRLPEMQPSTTQLIRTPSPPCRTRKRWCRSLDNRRLVLVEAISCGLPVIAAEAHGRRRSSPRAPAGASRPTTRARSRTRSSPLRRTRRSGGDGGACAYRRGQ
jgi:hypothetical protein